MNNLNMINRRIHGQWSCGWKIHREDGGWVNREGLYVNNFYGEELLITFDTRRNLVIVHEISEDVSAPVEIRNYAALVEWLNSEIPGKKDNSFDEGCWMASNLINMGWKP